MKGAFGKEKNEFNTGNTKFLRSEEDYSVLLAEFRNQMTKQSVCIAQFFWNDSTGLRKIYLVSFVPLNISEHFSKITNVQELKLRFKNNDNIQIFTSFTDYETAFLNFIGVESSQALDLFNQITSIKEVGKLSSFVRSHMLDKPNIKEIMEELFKNFEDLTMAYKAIVMAKEQLSQLVPMEENILQYKSIEEQLTSLQRIHQTLPVYFDSKKEVFLTHLLKEKKLLLENLVSEISQSDNTLQELEVQKNALNNSLNSDKSASEVEKLELQILSLQEKKSQREKALQQYNSLIKIFKLTIPHNKNEFLQNYKMIESQATEIKSQISPLEEEIFSTRVDIKKLDSQKSQLEEEISSLKNRKNKLPLNYISARETIATHLGVPVSKIPFVAELIKVKDEHKEWKDSIEKLLGGFALRILVPDEYASKVHRFVTNNKFNLKLVYHNVSSSIRYEKDTSSKSSSKILNKIEFRPKMSEYTQWLENKIEYEYNFDCVDNLKDYSKFQKAITKEGLIKRNANLHEKDDRNFSQSHSTGSSLLGWDNSDYQNELLILLSKVLNDKNKIEKNLEKILANIEDLRNKNLIASQILQINDFSTLNSLALIEQIDQLLEQKKILTQKNKNFARIKSNLQDVVEKIKDLLKNRDKFISTQGVLHSEIQSISKNLNSVQKINVSLEDAQSIESLLKKEKIVLTANNVQEFELLRYKINDILDSKLQHTNQRKNGHMTNIIRKMAAFKNQFSEYTTHLDSSIESIPGFLKLKVDIEKQSLPEHEQKFKKLLDKSLVNDMLAFKSTLDLGYEKIEEDIKNLNSSLITIPYTANTYVSLCVIPAKDTEIREFQHMLKHALSSLNKSQNTPANLEESFTKIKKIIDILKTQERYANKVTDVRQWADFYVSENYLQDHTQKNFYSDSAGLSGGQKVKLAFTILASAIAFQYGLNKENAASKSFRFVVIDEAFSKSDEVNSKYAMQLFKDLGLQLMVVTPKDKIYVVEPFVKNIFLSQMNEKTNTSKLLTFNIEHYAPEISATA